MTQVAKLALEDGTVFTGVSFGATGEVEGEVCFNTSMTGYQEILTDPSYRGQIVAMTYPEIGNYGVNGEDVESSKPHLAGFIVRQKSRRASNFRATGDLGAYLSRAGVVGLANIDTRALVRHIRDRGAMKGVLSTIDLNDESLVAKAISSRGLVGRDLVREVIPDQPRDWHERLSHWTRLPAPVGQAFQPDTPADFERRPGDRQNAKTLVAACRGNGLRNEMEHRTAFGRYGLPSDDPAWHRVGG